MKFFLMIFTSIICFLNASSLSIKDDKLFQTIYAGKQNNDKIIMMLYTATTCPQCAYMKQKVFKDSNVKDFLEKHFAIIEKNIDTDELPEGFDYFGVPTMFFIDKNGHQLSKFIGSSRAEPFLKTLQIIVEKK